MKRILGVIMLLVGIAGLALAVAGIYFGRQAVDQIGVGVNHSLNLVLDSLSTVQDSFALTKTAVNQASTAISTVEKTVADTSTTIGDTKPLVDQISVVAATEIPNSVEAIQASLYPAAALAAQVDTTLRTLSDFTLEQTFLGVPLQFDLGIDYDPQDALDESLLAIADSLDGVSGSLRDLEPTLTVNAGNLTLMSDNIAQISEDIAAINEVVADIVPLLDQYVDTITQVETAVLQVQANLDSYLQTAKLVITVLMIWLAALHLAPLYVGWELTTGVHDRKDDDEQDDHHRSDDEGSDKEE
ncbi:MAG: hypothetical protein KC441_11730 [Anaerolineales bacterium]|nr:hypothetical protein [Anaerolineales bacterium]